MFNLLRTELSAKLLTVIFLLLSLLWLYLNTYEEPGSIWHTIFTDTYGLVALVGGVVGLMVVKQWGGIKSLMGRAIFFFSLGLLFQELGQILYMYYIHFLQVEVPYPSWGDIGYFGSIPFYTYGALLLAQSSGIRFSLQKVQSKITGLVLPLMLLATSYFFFLQGYEIEDGAYLKTFLDFGYPLGQAIYVSVALLSYILLKRVLGGIMKNVILFMLFALLVQYFCDFFFLYETNRGTWYPSGINDYMYLFSYFLMGMSLVNLKAVSRKLFTRVA